MDPLASIHPQGQAAASWVIASGPGLQATSPAFYPLPIQQPEQVKSCSLPHSFQHTHTHTHTHKHTAWAPGLCRCCSLCLKCLLAPANLTAPLRHLTESSKSQVRCLCLDISNAHQGRFPLGLSHLPGHPQHGPGCTVPPATPSVTNHFHHVALHGAQSWM